MPLVMAGFYAAVVAAVAIHELGHAIAARLLGYRVVLCAVGFGRPLMGVRLLGGMWAVRRGVPHWGLTLVTYPGLVIPRWRQGLMLLAGPAANLVVANVAVGLMFHQSLAAIVLLLLLAAGNAWIMVCSVTPLRFRAGGAVYMSDGLQVFRLVVGVRGEWADVITLHRTLRPVLADIADRLALARYADAAAIGWSLLGATEPAAEALAEAESNRCPGADRFERALAAVARGAVAQAAGLPDAPALLVEASERADDPGLKRLAEWLRTDTGHGALSGESDPVIRCRVYQIAAGSDPERAVEHLGSAVSALIQAGRRLSADDRALLVPATDRLLLAFRAAVHRAGRDARAETVALLTPLYRGRGKG